MQIKSRQHQLRCVGVWFTGAPNISVSSHVTLKHRTFFISWLMALELGSLGDLF